MKKSLLKYLYRKNSEIPDSVLAEKNNPNKRTIALVNKQNYSLLQSSLKINDLVDPRLMTISTILKHVHKGTIETVYTLLDGEYEFIEAEVLANL